MNIDVRHLVSLDIALNTGITLDWRGKQYRVAGLTWGDLGELVEARKSRAMRVYREASKQDGTNKDIKEYDRMVGKILFRGATEDDFNPADPLVTLTKLLISLRKNHPEITQETVNEMLSDDEFRNTVVSVVEKITQGPVGEGAEKPDDGNPLP